MSEYHTPSRTVGVFLGAVAVSLRRTGLGNTEFLERLESRLCLTAAKAEHFGLTEDDLLHLRQMEQVFRAYMTDPELGLYDPPEGSA